MIRRDGSTGDRTSALEAYAEAARAEADAHFDERRLEAQRARILQRIDQAGQPARVLRFPGTGPGGFRPSSVSRRWISVAAAAGLLVGILTGQLVHVPSGAWQTRTPALPAPAVVTELPPAVPMLTAGPVSDDDALLNAIDFAVQYRGVQELRALEDLTFAYEPR